mgnify:CR=1 FL=1
MQSFTTAAHLREALALSLSPAVEDTFTLELQDMTHILVIEDGDSREEIGFDPSDDCPAVQHDGLVELVYTVGNSEFAYLIFKRAP